MPTVTIKAMSPAYFRLLERQPQMREVFQLGKRVVWHCWFQHRLG